MDTQSDPLISSHSRSHRTAINIRTPNILRMVLRSMELNGDQTMAGAARRMIIERSLQERSDAVEPKKVG